MYAAKVNYDFVVAGPPPPGYPAEPVADAYSAAPFAAEFEARRRGYLAHVRRNPAPPNLKAPYYELARLAAGDAPHTGVFYAALDYIEARKDCADFVLHAVLRLLYQFPDRVDAALLDRARETVLGRCSPTQGRPAGTRWRPTAPASGAGSIYASAPGSASGCPTSTTTRT
ncbi:MAG: hypothetical protein P8129_19310 [Anaerolineae bacterium]